MTVLSEKNNYAGWLYLVYFLKQNQRVCNKKCCQVKEKPEQKPLWLHGVHLYSFTMVESIHLI